MLDMAALVTTSEDAPETIPVVGSVAVIVAVPAAMLVARPVVEIVATVAGVAAQVTLVVLLLYALSAVAVDTISHVLVASALGYTGGF